MSALRSRRLHPLVLLVATAIGLRFFVFLGRGDYVAYDEAWYLILGRNLWAGEGYTLAGLRHVALSPLFPILAGGLDRILSDAVWAGRTVAVVAGGLLVVPCWSVVRRLAGARTALLACAFVAVLPALAPFAAPRWMGWDLWMGPEPLLHLFLFGGIALLLRALDTARAADWALAGASFAAAYLARPEALVPAALVAAFALAIVLFRRRRPRRAAAAAASLGLAFAALAAPYWLYLHDALGRWALTGRTVEVSMPVLTDRGRGDGGPAGHATGAVESALWQRSHAYTRTLYALHPSGTRMANPYWGVPPRDEAAEAGAMKAAPVPPASQSGEAARAAAVTAPAAPAATAVGGPDAAAATAPPPPAADSAGAGAAAQSRPPPAPSSVPGRPTLYARALGKVIPAVFWPFLVLGALAPGRRRRAEAVVALPLVATSLLVAAVVAVDPRTQLFLAPLAAFYAARGVRLAGWHVQRRLPRAAVRRGFAAAALTGVVLVALLFENARRVYLGTTEGSGQQIIGTEHRFVGELLARHVPPGEAFVSWHPQLALHARRDWHPLPLAGLREVIRYADAVGANHILFGIHNPMPIAREHMPREYMLLRIPSRLPGDGAWRIRVESANPLLAVARLEAP